MSDAPADRPTLPPRGTSELPATLTARGEAPRSSDFPATDIPGYELLEQIASGGMGVVFKARQTRLNRVVALKMVMGEHRAGERELARFLVEAEAAAAVTHPNVVPIFEYGESRGRPAVGSRRR